MDVLDSTPATDKSPADERRRDKEFLQAEEVQNEAAPGEVEEPEELLENDLYLLTQQGQEEEEAAATTCLRGQRKRCRTESLQNDLLSLPAPEPQADGAEAEAAKAQESKPTEASDDAEEKAPKDDAQPSSKRKKFESKPVEARPEGDDEAPWVSYPSLAAAARETGVPCGSVSSLADFQGIHSGFTFRWPGVPQMQPPKPARQPEMPPLELDSILERLRAMPASDRRGAIAAMPEAARASLAKHLKEEAEGSRLRALLGHLPQYLESISEERRAELLEGVRHLEALHAQILAAPDIATVVGVLREVTPAQRHALIELLPAETQQALQAHLRAEKAARDAAKAVQAHVQSQALDRSLPALHRAFS